MTRTPKKFDFETELSAYFNKWTSNPGDTAKKEAVWLLGGLALGALVSGLGLGVVFAALATQPVRGFVADQKQKYLPAPKND